MKFDATKLQSYIKRAFALPTEPGNIERRVFVEWNKPNQFRAGIEENTADHGWVPVAGTLNVVQSEQAMWETADMLWQREAG